MSTLVILAASVFEISFGKSYKHINIAGTLPKRLTSWVKIYRIEKKSEVKELAEFIC